MRVETCSYRITVTGLVQGVGFRPMVAELAEECNLLGQVKNLGGVVEIIVSGKKEAVEMFLHRLNRVHVGRIDTMHKEELEELNSISKESDLKSDEFYGISSKGFQIAESQSTRERKRILPVDFSTCDRCKAELFDPTNRRYRYPFISCTQCGPRYSVQKAVPYDRESITMDVFSMCPECENEYKEKGNIRRHAQTIACHGCGPQLRLVAAKNAHVSNNSNIIYDIEKEVLCIKEKDNEKILAEAIKALQQDKIVAIKDIGGFHFTFSPFSSKAASRLREFKARDKKPFAVMFYDLEEIKEYCQVNSKEEELLLSNARPIVLLEKRNYGKEKKFVPEICGDSDRIGAMLPCNPLQLLLLKETGPLVMTSGNRGGEPIIIDDRDMEELIKHGCPDMMLTHDREILTPLDDSVYQVNGEYVQLIRRARGLVPEPIEINKKLQQDIYAAGGDLKASFALGRDNLVYLSQYFGDLEDVRCTKRRQEALVRMQSLLEIEPNITVGDLHPSYISSQNTQVKVQHHHAHVASVIAEHGLEEKVIGIACDGTGYGTDGTVWGCEFFLFEAGKSTSDEMIGYEESCLKKNVGINKTSYAAASMTRVGSLSKVKMLGGDAAAKEADKTLFSYLMEARDRGIVSDAWYYEAISTLGQSEFAQVEKANMANETENKFRLQELAWKQNINTVYSSSLGRLFDAVAALLDICHYNSYEGECAVLLEQAAHKGKVWFDQHLDMNPEQLISIIIEETDDIWIADGVKLIVDLQNFMKSHEKTGLVEGTSQEWKAIMSYLFHHAVSSALVSMAEQVCKKYDVSQIVLSGGSFVNRILFSETRECLQRKGFRVYSNEKVPCGDGGIALGQAFLLAK